MQVEKESFVQSRIDHSSRLDVLRQMHYSLQLLLQGN